MSLYQGIEGPKFLGLTMAERTWLSTNMLTLDDNVYAPVAFATSIGLAGPKSQQDPLFTINEYNGEPVGTINPPLYSRFLIVEDTLIVAEINAGAVVVDSILIFGIWNGWKREDEVDTIVLSQPDAISISGITAGTIFTRYEEIEVTATILASAPPVVDCTVTITMLSGEIIVFTITATVSIDVLFRPERNPVEFISFMTDVITARNGVEQRRNLRKYPRHSLSVTYLEPDTNRRAKLKMALIGGSGQRLGFPYWHMVRYADSQPVVGDSVITVDTSYATYLVGGLCMLYEEGTTVYEIRKINAFTGTDITLEDLVENNYTRCQVMPYYDMKVSTPVKWQDFTNHTKFDLEGMSEVPVEVDEYVFDEYKSLGVLPYECNLFKSKSTETSIMDDILNFDAMTGGFTNLAEWDDPKLKTLFGIHATTREECYQLRQIIYALRGRQKTVWVPSFESDFVPTVDLFGVNITVDDNKYADYLDASDYYNHIAVYRNGEVPIYTEITNAVAAGGAITLTVLDAMPVIDKNEVKISLMTRCRLNSDTTEIEWVSPSECFCNTQFLSVKE